MMSSVHPEGLFFTGHYTVNMVYMQSDLPFGIAAEPLTLTQFIPDCCLEKGTLNGIVTNPGRLAERAHMAYYMLPSLCG